MRTIEQRDSLSEDRLSAAVRLVNAILNDRGEISVGEIEAIPFIESESDVEMILNYLSRNENIEIVQRKVATSPLIRWEKFIQRKR